VRRFRAAGLTLHPTFVAFTPWISRREYLEMLEEVERLDLVENLASVQLAIRLLIPAGSRLLELPDVRALVGPFDEAALVYPWAHTDPGVDALHREVETMVREAAARNDSRAVTFERALALARGAGRGSGLRHDTMHRGSREPKRPPVPFLTEPWYC
jgi:hypothetical protein